MMFILTKISGFQTLINPPDFPLVFREAKSQWFEGHTEGMENLLISSSIDS